MRRIVRCTCGVEISDTDEQALIRKVQAHAREAHGLTLSDDQVRDMMEIAQ